MCVKTACSLEAVQIPPHPMALKSPQPMDSEFLQASGLVAIFGTEATVGTLKSQHKACAAHEASSIQAPFQTKGRTIFL